MRKSILPPDTTEGRYCPDCCWYQPFSEFYTAKPGKLQRYCKAHYLARSKTRYEQNREDYIATQMRWQRENPERMRAARQRYNAKPEVKERQRELEQQPHIKETRRRYDATHREELRQKNAEYRTVHRDDLRASAERYRQENAQVLSERHRRWREEHPDSDRIIHSKWKSENKDAVNATTHRRRARIKGNGGSFTAAEWQALKARYDHRCLMCERREPEIKLTIDHVVSLFSGGPNTIDNVAPLCKSCNSKKATRHIDLRPLAQGALFATDSLHTASLTGTFDA